MALTLEPTARARCGNTARRDLCGGRLESTDEEPSLPRPLDEWMTQLRGLFGEGRAHMLSYLNCKPIVAPRSLIEAFIHKVVPSQA
jgi:hypothetical protein